MSIHFKYCETMCKLVPIIINSLLNKDCRVIIAIINDDGIHTTL